MNDQTPLQVLNSVFGYGAFRHHQAEIIDSLMSSKDVLTLMPTGGGKSLCYQIPAILRDGTGIVVSPLIALMQDQVDALKQLNISAAFLNSSLDNDTQRETEQKLLNGELSLLYVAPERLLTQRMIHLLKQIKVSLFAIDEAHCVSQWGHDFRKEYQQLSVLHEHFPEVPRIALTATADKRTRGEIINQLNLQNAATFVNSFDRPNIHYKLSEGQNARNELWKFIQNEHPQDAGIIYCLSRKKVESTAQWLNEKGRKALPYHAGLSDQERQTNQARFLREDGLIIVATIAFGMGIDKPDVRFVAHLNLPKSVEAYYQETGRAGRDGAPANAWMAYGLQDVIFLRQMLQSADANEQYKRVTTHKLDAMLALCEMTSCRRQALLAYFDEKLAEPCGNCDNCLEPQETIDGTEAARKALSCVYRSGQQFGSNYLIDILLGKSNDRIVKNHHDKLSTFGIGTELNAQDWRRVFRQLIAQGYLTVDLDGFGSMRLTENCRDLLRGEASFEMHKPREQEKTKTEKRKTEAKDLEPWNQELFEVLRSLRTKLAKEQNVPPYVIFQDASLINMANTRPSTLQEFQYIPGVGAQKLERYGELFLKTINECPLPEILNNGLSSTVKQTLYEYHQGISIEEIANKRELKSNTIYSHLADAIAIGIIDVRKVIKLDEEELQKIINTIEFLDAKTEKRIKPVFEALDEHYDYGTLKCVMASM